MITGRDGGIDPVLHQWHAGLCLIVYFCPITIVDEAYE